MLRFARIHEPSGRLAAASVLVPNRRSSSATISIVSSGDAARLSEANAAGTVVDPQGRRSTPRSDASSGASVSGGGDSAKSFPGLKVKRSRGPWGQQQLRDSWTDEAMSYRENEKIGKRLSSKLRYHPDHWLRFLFSWAALVYIVTLPFGMWWFMYKTAQAEGITVKQVRRRVLRQFYDRDISPRSEMKPFKLFRDIPPHVLAHRERKKKELEQQQQASKAESDPSA